MQSNEELVAAIRAGDRSELLTLWEQNLGLIRNKAWEVLNARHECRKYDVELDDLMQAGFLGLVDAVERYDLDGKFKFITLLGMTLKTAFAEATGWRTNKQQADPIHSAASLDQSLGDDPDGENLGTLSPNPVDYIQEAEGRIYREQLHEALEAALSDLPADQERVLRLRYYQGKGYKEVEGELSLSPHKCRSLEFSGLSTLRQGRGKAARLYEFMEDRTNYYKRVPARSQRAPVEELVIRREELEEKFFSEF